MLISTVRFGEIEIQESEIIAFPEGIPGFEQLNQFIIIKPNQELPFSFLQSVEEGAVAFIISNPFVFYPEYEFEISEETKHELSIEAEQDVLVWNIISIRDDLENATINLLAPVIVNIKEQVGKQIVLQGTDYTVKHKLILTQQVAAEGGDI
ncbi:MULTISPECIES: flagellar assembly protein FliW [unclassified Paenibacillus]|uniref:flagellar assembly protein FliW n=1 Tax=unclassified Paenibacillus TaxID=185978 RepID=UPI0036332703